jgi:hypothetical protein
MTQPTTERDRIKERVAKLLNLTLDKGASENEAIMARRLSFLFAPLGPSSKRFRRGSTAK